MGREGGRLMERRFCLSLSWCLALGVLDFERALETTEQREYLSSTDQLDLDTTTTTTLATLRAEQLPPEDKRVETSTAAVRAFQPSIFAAPLISANSTCQQFPDCSGL